MYTAEQMLDSVALFALRRGTRIYKSAKCFFNIPAMFAVALIYSPALCEHFFFQHILRVKALRIYRYTM